MEFRDQLTRRMKQLSITQRELAEKSGLAPQSISKYVRNQGKPNYKAIISLAQALEVHPIWFFEDIELRQMQELQELIKAEPKPAIALHPEAIEPGTLVIGHWLPMRHLPSPFQGHSLGAAPQLYGMIFSSLLRWDYRDLHSDLALDWKRAEGGWLFQLRPNVRFHDGTPLTADDVCWSYQQHLENNPAELSLVGAQAVGDSFVLLYTKHQCELTELAMPPVLPVGSTGDGQLIGTGPFRLLEKRDTEWRLGANPYYFCSQPYIRELVIREYEGEKALEDALAAREIHYARGVYVVGDGLVPEVEPTLKRYQLHFMMNEPLIQDKELRQAIASGLDREKLAEAVGLKAPLYSSGSFDTALGDLADTAQEPDTERANRLLELSPAFRAQSIDVVYYPKLPAYTDLAKAVCEQLGQLGFAARVAQPGQPAHIMLTTRPVGDVRMEMRHWLTGDRLNLTGYSNEAVDHLIQQAGGDHPSLMQLRELRQHIQQDMPDIPLFYDEMPITYVDRLRVRDGGIPSLNRLFDIHNWYLEPARMKKEED